MYVSGVVDFCTITNTQDYYLSWMFGMSVRAYCADGIGCVLCWQQAYVT